MHDPRVTKSEQLEAVLEVILSVAYGDAALSDTEVHMVRGYVERLSDASRSDVDAMIAAATLRLEKDGVDARLRWAAETLGTEEAKLVALRLAHDAAAQDRLEAGERGALHDAAVAMGIDPAVLDRFDETA